jgi:hypothetical protein
MTDDEYERLVHDLLSDLVGGTPALLPSDVAGGAKNTIIGASGFAHQIEVSVRAQSFLVLVECKYWSRPVDAKAVLVLASRLADIRDANPSLDVRASLVSTKASTEGARVLAAHFGISLDIVSSIKEYAVRLRNQVFASVVEALSLSDRCDAEVIRGKAG